MTKVTTQMDAWTENELLGEGWHRLPRVEATWTAADPLAVKVCFGPWDTRAETTDWYMGFELFQLGSQAQMAGAGDVRFSGVPKRPDLAAMTLIGWAEGAATPDVATILLNREHMRNFVTLVQDSRSADQDVVQSALNDALTAILEGSDGKL